MHRFSMTCIKGCIRKHITVRNFGEYEAQTGKEFRFSYVCCRKELEMFNVAISIADTLNYTAKRPNLMCAVGQEFL